MGRVVDTAFGRMEVPIPEPWPSGGSTPVTKQAFNGSGLPQTVASGAYTLLQWLAPTGDTLLDLTDPAQPTVLTEGTYSITVTGCIDASVAVPAGSFVGFVELDLDANGSDGYGSTTFPVTAAQQADIGPQGGVSVTWYVEVGGVITAALKHNTGQAQAAFLIAMVQRLS